MKYWLIPTILSLAIALSACTNDEPSTEEKGDGLIYLTMEEAIDMGFTCTGPEEGFNQIAENDHDVIEAKAGDDVEIKLLSPARILAFGTEPPAAPTSCGFSYNPIYRAAEPNVFIFIPHVWELTPMTIDHTDPYKIKIHLNRQYVPLVNYCFIIGKDNINDRAEVNGSHTTMYRAPTYDVFLTVKKE